MCPRDGGGTAKIVAPQCRQNGIIVDDAVDFTRKMMVDELMCTLAHVAASALQRAHREMHFECACEMSQPGMKWFLRWNLSTRL